MGKKEKRSGGKHRLHGSFAEQAISDPAERYPQTGVAKPSDSDVEEAREWVNSNEK